MGHLQYSLEDFEEEEKKAQERNTGRYRYLRIVSVIRIRNTVPQNPSDGSGTDSNSKHVFQIQA